MQTPGEFAGKVAFVTGAASGLGRATALAFGRLGADLSLMDVDAEGLDESAAQVEALGVQVISSVADVSIPTKCHEAIAQTVSELGRFDVLCNVAGVFQFAHAIDLTPADWERMLGVNLSGPFYLCQAAIPHLLKTEGNIVNVASSAAFVGEAYAAPYCATKAGLVSLTRALAMEYIRQPIRINAISPGGMQTAMVASAEGIPTNADMELIQRYTGIRDVSEPEEVADLIVYLASDRARSIHGACLSIDGGITAG